MPEYWVITGIGHCGTKWLSTVFNHQDGIIGLHEYKQSVTGMPWDKAARYESQYGLKNKRYVPYFEAMENALADVVVDANSWSPALLPQVNEIKKIDRIIYIIRNGVSQLHSLKQSQVWANAPVTSFIYKRYLQPYFNLTDYNGRSMAGVDKWERLCLFWLGSVRMPQVLMDAGLPVELVTFESLTQGGELRTIGAVTNNEELRHWRGQDINRKVEGDRRPNTLFMEWTDYERNVFESVCWGEMERLGYQIPGA